MEQALQPETLHQVREKIEEIFRYRRMIDDAKEGLMQMQGELRSLQEQVLNTLQAAGLEKFSTPVGTVSVREKTSVRIPKTPEDRKAFFDYLRERNLFDDMISVNSMTLNSWFNREREIAEEDGIYDFRVPGLNEVSTYYELSTRKA